MSEEIWRDIPGFEGFYQVSSLGNVRSLDRVVKRKTKTGLVHNKTIKGKLIAQSKAGKGYLKVTLCVNNKHNYKYVHHLVWATFKGVYNTEKYNIDHINEIKTDNRLLNLQLLSMRENTSKGWAKFNTSSKYTGVIKVKGLYKAAIRNEGKRINLGYFKKEEDAHKAYQNKLNELIKT